MYVYFCLFAANLQPAAPAYPQYPLWCTKLLCVLPLIQSPERNSNLTPLMCCCCCCCWCWSVLSFTQRLTLPQRAFIHLHVAWKNVKKKLRRKTLLPAKLCGVCRHGQLSNFSFAVCNYGCATRRGYHFNISTATFRWPLCYFSCTFQLTAKICWMCQWIFYIQTYTHIYKYIWIHIYMNMYVYL